jgi:hemerythrin-like domain-containing protein
MNGGPGTDDRDEPSANRSDADLGQYRAWALVCPQRRVSAAAGNGQNDAALTFKKHADDYITLLDFHIEKENTVLFSMATRHLPGNKLVEMKNGFNKFESEEIGVGKHEQFHQL